MKSNIVVKPIKQPNLFKEGENKYYIQFISDKGSYVINVGEKTYNEVVKLTIETINETAKEKAEKLK